MRKPRATANEKNVLLAFGNPTVGAKVTALHQIAPRSAPMDPLPDAEREVNALQNLYGASAARVYLGAAVREDRAKAEATSYAILHFATHGVLDDASPLYSRLVLAQGDTNEDGMLEAWEIMRLNLQARLAVLSACETARGQIGTGERMIGLSWAFFIAGCPTTIASQWKVDSATTAKLMLDFHRRLRGDRQKPPLSIAKALQQSSLQLLQQGGITSHPFFWAGFVAVGRGE
ncbi:MAG: CHAT domain-containing protein [Acidobacteria bacterium]|nr:CHAT domain-containing protein [Acidobacteriota bacterium]